MCFQINYPDKNKNNYIKMNWELNTVYAHISFIFVWLATLNQNIYEYVINSFLIFNKRKHILTTENAKIPPIILKYRNTKINYAFQFQYFPYQKFIHPTKKKKQSKNLSCIQFSYTLSFFHFIWSRTNPK